MSFEQGVVSVIIVVVVILLMVEFFKKPKIKMGDVKRRGGGRKIG